MKNNLKINPNGYHSHKEVLEALANCQQSDEKESNKDKVSKANLNALDQILERHKKETK